MEPRAEQRAAPRLGAGAETGRRRARGRAREMSVEVTREIGERLPDLLPDPESFEANRASTEASILGFAQILEHGADPAAASLGAATLAYTQEGAQRGIPLTTLIRSYRLGHAAAWEAVTPLIAAHADDPEQRAIATQLCSALAVRLRRRSAVSRRGLLQRRTRALGAKHGRDASRDDRNDPRGPADRRRAGQSTLGVRARPPAHRGDRVVTVAQEGRDTHAAMEAAIARSGSGSAQPARSCTRSASCRSPPGSECMTPVSPASWMTSGSTRRRRPGFASRSANPRRASSGFRQSHNEAAQARRIAELAGRPPGTITRYAARRACRDRNC